MSLITMRQQCLRLLGLDVDSHLVADVKARLDDMINRHVNALGSRINWDLLKRNGTLTLASGTNVYSLPADCLGFRIFGDNFYSSSSNWKADKVSDSFFINQAVTAKTGAPAYWRPYGQDSSGNERVQFYPSPGNDQAGKTLSFEYSAEPAAATADADKIAFNETMVVYEVMSEYLMYDEDVNRARYYESKSTPLARTFMARSKSGASFAPQTRRNMK